MIDVNRIIELQERNVIEWHNQIVESESELPWMYIEENNKWNFKLWHEEDIARVKDIEPVKIVTAKRNIDSFNQRRNDAMEKIDEWVLNSVIDFETILSKEIPLHSETPGMMIDRLSIMGLKKYHMNEEANRLGTSEKHRELCADRVMLLNEQINDLAFCLHGVLEKIKNGQLKFKVYRQLKMYNDPTLNPQLYLRANGKEDNQD